MAEIKRPNYFTSQFLVESDFNDEQAYHLNMRRRHNRTLHIWGVVEGLQVSKTGSKEVSITPGMAIDRDGREIVLQSDPPPKPIDLSSVGGGDGVNVFITISYQDVTDPADHYSSGGVNNFTRITERPRLEAVSSPPTDGSVIILARVTLAAGGEAGQPDNSVRRLASSLIAKESELDLRSVTWANNSRLQADQGGSIELGGDNTTKGTGTPYIDFHFNGLTQDFNARIINDADGRLSLVASTLFASGKVGIGTPAPQGLLDVNGGSTQLDALFVRTNPNNSHGGIIHHQSARFAWQEAAQGTGGADGILTFNYVNRTSPSTVAAGGVLTLKGNGNVGVGTANQTEKLQVEGGSILVNGDNTGVIVDEGGKKRVGLMKYPGKEGGIWRLATLNFEVGRVNPEVTALPGSPTAFTTDLFIGANGRVGVGTNAPDRPLTVANAAGANYLNIKDGTREVLLGVDVDGAILSAMTGNDLVFRAGGNSEKMRIDANGRVGIGTANPGAKLEVAGDIKSPMWRVTQVLNSRQGALPLSGQFVTGGGTLMIFAYGSGFSPNGAATIGMQIQVDGVIKGNALCFTNEQLSHKSFVANALVVTGIAAGTHTLNLIVLGATVTDFNDRFSVTVLELPFASGGFIFVPPVVPLNPGVFTPGVS